MKHTMKKLLCMALAIMLLVSAVPVFAAADSGITILYYVNGEYVDSDTWDVETKLQSEILLHGIELDILPSNSVFSAAAQKGSSDHLADDYVYVGGSTYYFKVTSESAGSGSDGSGSGSEDNGSGSGSPTPAPTPTYSVQINVKLNGTEQGWYTVTIKDSTTTVQKLINHKVDGGLIEGYTFNTAYVSNTNTYLDADGTVKSGDKVYIAFTKEVATVEPINIVVKVDGSDNVVWTGSKVPANGESAKVADLLSYCWNSDWDDVYTFDHAWSHDQQKNVAKTGSINAGDTVYMMLNKKANTENGGSSTTGCGYVIDNLSKPGDVVLHVYLNNNFEGEHKAYTINSIAKDGKLSLMNDVKDFLTQYYTAKTSDGIEYRGMYVANGYYGVQYLNGYKREVIGGTELECGHTELEHLRAEGRVDLNVMLMNAKAKSTSSSTADTSNPKTGDTIFVPVMVMGVTATALAAAYVFGKKRIAR